MNGRLTLRCALGMLMLVLTVVGTAHAQRKFPYQFDIDSRALDTLHSPDATLPDHRYRITAWGTYSMWEDTVNSSVDPMWIYSFPDEEWAKPEWRVFTEGYPIWVGDSRLLNSHGLRIDGQPMAKQPLADNHRYVMMMQGDGHPVSVNLVDWNFRNFVQRDAHDNNSGWLHVLVEELPLVSIDICRIDSSNFPEIRLALKVTRDSVRVEDFLQDLVINENGRFVKPYKIDCAEHASETSTALVFDRSGSMREAFGTSTRMTYTRAAGKSFIDKLGPNDEAAIYSFDETTVLDQTWTSNKTLLKGAIDRLDPGGWTAIYDAAMRALSDIEQRPAARHKAIILLSDGEDNKSVVRGVAPVIERARRDGIPIFTVGLLLDSEDSLRLLASATGGRYFSVRDASAMDSVFASIADLVFEKGCCSVYYTTPNSRRDGSWRSVTPSVVFTGDTTTAETVGYHAPTGSAGVEDARVPASTTNLTVAPNPMGGTGELGFTLTGAARVTIDVLGLDGRVVATVADGVMTAGEHRQVLTLEGLPDGRYFVRLRREGETAIYPLLILR